MKRICLLVAFVLVGTASPPSDWPTILGPTRDGVSTEKGIIAPWPKEGLKKLWECDLGIGFAPPVVAGGQLFHFDRFGDNAAAHLPRRRDRQAALEVRVPDRLRGPLRLRPRPAACPVVDGDRVYIYGAEGMLHCLKADDGKESGSSTRKAKYHFHQNFFGVGSVPVVDGDLLIVPVGGSPKGPRPVDFRDVKPNGTGVRRASTRRPAR